MWIIRFLKNLFKNNGPSCDYCINRNCVSNNSICYECIDGDKYEFDEEAYNGNNN